MTEYPRVLYISYDGMTDPLGQSQVLPYLKRLSEEGYRYTLISFEKPEAFEKDRQLIEDHCQSAQIQWRPQTYTKKPPVLSTVKDVRKMRSVAQVIASEGIEIIHCRGYLPALAGLSVQRRSGAKLVFDMRGFWPDERVDGGLWNLSNPLYWLVYRFFKKREKQFLQSADATISLTEAGKAEMLKWEVGVEPENIHVIPCCADFEHFDPAKYPKEKVQTVRTELGIPEGANVFCYLGSIGTWYMLDEMLEFFAQALKKVAHLHLLFVTRDDREMILSKAAEFGIPAAKLTITPASRDQVPEYLAASDTGFFFITPAFSKMSSSPTKLAEILAMGKPVICNTGVGDIDTLFANHPFGIALDVFKQKEWSAAIDRIESLADCDSQQIRSLGQKLFGLESGVQTYAAVYRRLVSQLKSPDQK